MTHEYEGVRVKYSVRNVGTVTATGVTVSFHFKDLEANSSDIASAAITDKETDNSKKEQTFTWEVGTILAGGKSGEFKFATVNHPGYTTGGRIGVITATASSNQPEPGLLSGSNKIKVYSFIAAATGASLHMPDNKLGLLLGLDDLRPAPGGDVDFDLTARNFNPSASSRAELD